MAFGDKIRVRIKQISTGQNERKKRAAGAIIFNLVQLTPIKSGRAKAGWRATLNRPTRAEAIRTDYASTLQTSLLTIKRAKSEDQIYVASNVPYISDLNAGSSPQAPPGFVGIAVSLGIAEAGAASSVRVFF